MRRPASRARWGCERGTTLIDELLPTVPSGLPRRLSERSVVSALVCREEAELSRQFILAEPGEPLPNERARPGAPL